MPASTDICTHTHPYPDYWLCRLHGARCFEELPIGATIVDMSIENSETVTKHWEATKTKPDCFVSTTSGVKWSIEWLTDDLTAEYYQLIQ